MRKDRKTYYDKNQLINIIQGTLIIGLMEKTKK